MGNFKEYMPLGGSWEITDLIGKGSYGEVYRAVRSEMGQVYYSAFKHISIPQEGTGALYGNGIAMDDEAVREYYSRALQDLLIVMNSCYRLKGHANIAVYEDHYIFPKEDESGNETGYDIFIRMELLKPLYERLREKPLTEKEIIKLGIDICAALEILEHEQILHLDIKPSNIFLGSTGDYKLGDYGFAKVLNRVPGTNSGGRAFDYIAPEQQRGTYIDHRADIYALGLVLYRLCNAGRNPFLPAPPALVDVSDNDRATERRLNGEALPAPANASAALAEIILKATKAAPENRFASAAEMKNALVLLLDAPQYTGGAPHQQTGPTQNGGPHQGYVNGGHEVPPQRQTRKSGTMKWVVVMLSAILLVVAAGVVLLLFKDRIFGPEAEEKAYAPYVSDETDDSNEDRDEEDAEAAAHQPSAPSGSAVPSAAPADTGSDSGFILPYSATSYLSDSDLSGLDYEELRFGRYEIFARHDCLFDIAWVQEHFNRCTWYDGHIMPRDFDESVLNSFELKNLGLILQHEKAVTGYIINDSDSRYLTVMDLLGLSDEESCLARNEIFARHNRLFDLAWIQEYFDDCPWYAGNIRPEQFNNNVFSDIEKANIDTIQAYEARFD